MRRLLATLTVLSILLVPSLVQAETPISLFVGGAEIKTDVPPVLENGRTLVPLRALTEALGFTVSWEEATQTATLIKGDQTIQLTIGQTEALVNGKPVKLDVPPAMRNGRMVIPVRFVAEQIGLEVTWDEVNQVVGVKEKAPPAPPVKPAEPVQPPKPSQPVLPGRQTTVDPAAISLMERMAEGSYRSSGALAMTVSDAMFSITIKMTMEQYQNGSDTLVYGSANIMGVESKSGNAVYQGDTWVQDPDSGEWTKLSNGAPSYDPMNPVDLNRLKWNGAAGGSILLTEESFEGVSMQVVTVDMDLSSFPAEFSEVFGEVAEGSITMRYWFDENGDPHHVHVIMQMTTVEEATLKMEGTMFYEVWDEPIPFPAEILEA